jgi:NADH-quinone oxidoreductase subunit J
MSRLVSLAGLLLLVAGPALAQPAPARARLELSIPGMWSTPELWVFLVFAAGALAGALFTVTRKNLITAVIGLVGSFFCLAGIYVLLYAHFLAAIQVLVYAGAIMVLFVFVIMMLGRDDTEPWAMKSLTTKLLGGGGAVIVLGLTLLRVLGRPGPALSKEGAPPAGFGSVEAFGDLLFKDYLFPFEAVSLLLLLAVIGAVVIARGRHGAAAPTPAAPPAAPEGGPAPAAAAKEAR